MVGKDLLKILKESKYTTVLSGFEMLQENGYPAIRDGGGDCDKPESPLHGEEKEKRADRFGPPRMAE